MDILIVDDDEIALQMLGHALTREGHNVHAVTNGLEALRKLEGGLFRIVICDWEMPGMDGVELCRQIRQRDSMGYIYTILLTARDGAQNVVEGLSAGADDFINKPFNPAELQARIQIGQRLLALETRDLTIFAMAKLAESRDPETGAHLERVRNYSRVLAQHMSGVEKFRGQIDRSFVHLIYLTSPLHDIGKIAIPDSILLKPGRLSDKEFEVMKSHAMLGAQTLEAALEQHPGTLFLQMARDIAATHHERWDGDGYPARLSGTDIPLAGRIVSLADVYDALTTKRVYKNAMQHDVSRSIIVEGSGTHFDPDVVEAFLSQEPRFMEVRRQFSDSWAEAA